MRIRTTAALVALLAACSTVALQPAPEARQVTGDKLAARASDRGVTLVADTDAWSGVPEEIQGVIPLLVTLTNQSDVPLRVGPSVFQLVAGDGTPFAATPPDQIIGQAVALAPLEARTSPYVGILGDGIVGMGYDYVPVYGPWYTGFGAWPGAVTWAPWYYPYFEDVHRVQLPTPDIVRRALDEKVLAPGQTVTGFLYFKDLPGAVKRADLHQTLIDADSGEPFGDITIPLQR